jgi:hypothetical protein
LRADAPQAGDEFQVFGRLEFPVQQRVVRQVGHAALGTRRVARKVDAEHLDAAFIGRQQARDHAQRRRLAGTVGAQQRIQFAAPHRQIEAVDGRTAKGFAQRGQAQGGRRCSHVRAV